MNDKELWELMSIICEGQDSEQRRKVEQYITDLQKEIERLHSIIKEVRELIKRDLSTDKVNNLIYSELLDIIGEENK